MQFKVLDIFAGCGGLSLGLSQAGFQVVAACEIDEWAAETYAANHPDVELFQTDIRNLESDFLCRRFRGEINVVAGGPPCQGFSVSGKRQYGVHLDKNQLLYEYIRVVEAIRPQFFILENVRGFATAKIDKMSDAFRTAYDMMHGLGYHVYHAVLQAADFGVPQIRNRLIIIGSLDELRFDPFPVATHSERGELLTKPYVSVGEAILDLPVIYVGEGSDGAQVYTIEPSTSIQRQLRWGSCMVYNHVAMKHTPKLVERFSMIAPGGSGFKMNGVGDDGSNRIVTVYKMNNQRLVEKLPSLCITANFQSNYIHPRLNRNLTAREAARIMTFPDIFIFKGKRTLMSSTLLASEGRTTENHLSQYNQIGNAVPPLLARVVGERLAEVIASSVHEEYWQGGLPVSTKSEVNENIQYEEILSKDAHFVEIRGSMMLESEFDQGMLSHKNNLSQKLIVTREKFPSSLERAVQIKEMYSHYISSLDYSALTRGDATESVAVLETYLKAAKELEKQDKVFNWRSDFAGSIIPEFIYRALYAILKEEGLEPLFSARDSVVEVTMSGSHKGGWNIRRKNQDLSLGLQMGTIITDGEKHSFLVPLIVMEVKTNIDINKLNGLDFSAERLKRTFPNARYLLVTETIDFSLKDNYASGYIDEIYVLRRQLRSKARKNPDPLQHGVFEILFADILEFAKKASVSKGHVYERLADGKLIH